MPQSSCLSVSPAPRCIDRTGKQWRGDGDILARLILGWMAVAGSIGLGCNNVRNGLDRSRGVRG